MRKLKVVTFLSLLIVSFGCSASAQQKTQSSTYQAAADYSASMRGLAVVVMKGERIVFEEYQNGHSAETPHLLASGTKSFSGVLLAAAIEDKLIKSFDEKVADTITEWNNDPRKSKITMRQLLTLTGGLDGGTLGRSPTYSEAIKMATKFEPGEKFEYGPMPFQVFGEVLRRKLAVKNESVMDYLKRRILDPIGLKVADWTMQEGQPNLPSGAYLTAREWLKFGQLLKNGGKWNSKQLIKKSLLDELYVGSKANPNYGLTFWLNRSSDRSARISENRTRLQSLMGDRESETTDISMNGFGKGIPNDAFVAAGAGKQRLYVIPSLDLVVVRQGRQSRFDDEQFLNLLINGKSN